MKRENLSNLTDFLSDDSFVHWVRYGSEDIVAAEKWDNWVKQNPEKQELVNEAKAYLAVFNSSAKPMDTGRKELLRSKILEKISDKSIDTNVRPFASRYKIVWYAAASVVIMISVLYLRLYQQDVGPTKAMLISQTNVAGQVTEIKLSDGSMVTLSAASSLQYPEQFDKNLREVILRGEAYFSVVSDAKRPFIVNSGLVHTEVLGTEFNISAYSDEDIEVSLTEGKIRVYENSNNENELILSPSERAIFSRHNYEFNKVLFDEGITLAWMNSRIVFRDAGLNEIKKKLEKWYDVKIYYENMPRFETKLNADFSKDSFEKVLKTIGLTLGFEYEADEKTIKINFSSVEE